MDIEGRLVHTAQLSYTYVGTASMFGGTEATSITTVTCYYYDDNRTLQQGDVETLPTVKKILVGPTVGVREKDKFLNVVDEAGTIILVQGVVEDIRVYPHKDRGIEFRELTLSRN